MYTTRLTTTHPNESKQQAKDPQRIAAILTAAQERARLKKVSPGSTFDPDDPRSEFVQGLTLEEAATLLNVDATDPAMVQPLYDAALNVKEQIYGGLWVGFGGCWYDGGL